MENYKIQIHERKYINQDDVQVTVSFQLPFRDWLTIEKSNEWCQIERPEITIVIGRDLYS